MLLAAFLALNFDDLLANFRDDDMPNITALRTQSFDIGSDGRIHSQKEHTR